MSIVEKRIESDGHTYYLRKAGSDSAVLPGCRVEILNLNSTKYVFSAMARAIGGLCTNHSFSKPVAGWNSPALWQRLRLQNPLNGREFCSRVRFDPGTLAQENKEGQ